MKKEKKSEKNKRNLKQRRQIAFIFNVHFNRLSSCVCLFHQEQKLSLPKAWVMWLSWNTKGAGKANIWLARLCSEKVRGRKTVRMTLGLSASRVCHSGIRGPLMSRELVVLPTKSLAVLYWKNLKLDGSQRLEVKFSLLS